MPPPARAARRRLCSATPARGADPASDEATKNAQITDYYAPIALIAAGLITYFFDARLFGIHNLIFAFFFVVIKAVINLVLVFTGLMIGVKLIDLGLGRIGPAMLKIAAVALLPGALGDIIGYYTMGWVPWGHHRPHVYRAHVLPFRDGPVRGFSSSRQ